MHFVWALLVLALLSGCNRTLALTDPPGPPGPGSIQGTLVFAEPGRATLQPAIGATIELLGSSVSTTSGGDNGYFNLAPVTRQEGVVLFRFDANRDGLADFQKILRLEDLKAGPGKNIVLGQIQLGGNASIRGSALRRDFVSASSGHAGTTIFVPEGPFTTYSGDNGAFTLENLPEGRITLAFFRDGYETSTVNLEVRAREVLTLNAVLLEPRNTPGQTTRVIGRVQLLGQAMASGVTISTSTGVSTQSDVTGSFTFPSMLPGVVSFGFEKPGFRSAVSRNVVIDGAEVDLGTILLVEGDAVTPMLDGSVPFDAGTEDAGQADAGLPDAGLPDAGAVDAGPPLPVAVVDPLAVFYPLSTTATLSGVNSTGIRPFSYLWTQDAGPAVTIMNNDSPLAATPTIRMPSAPATLKMALTVTDAMGRLSAPTEFTVTAAGTLPVAVIDGGFPSPIHASQRIQLSGAQSNDSSGSGIVSYEWSLMAGSSGVTGQAVAGTPRFEVTAPSTVPTDDFARVQLVVVNGLGLRSTPVSANVVVTSMAAPTWVLDAGRPTVVSGGTIVTLDALATAPSGAATFSYQWSPASGSSDGGPWQLLDPAARTTQFLAPVISGANLPLTFTVTATSTSGGLMPAQQSAVTFVTVQDTREPVRIATSVLPDGTTHPLGAWAEYDEVLSTDISTMNSINSSTPAGSLPAAPGVSTRGFVTPRRVAGVYASPAAQDTAIILNFSAVRDTSPGGNPTTPSSIVTRAAYWWLAPHSAGITSTAVFQPGVALVTGVTNIAHVFAAPSGNATFFAPTPVDQCDAGCALTAETSPAITVSGIALGHRGLTVQGQPYAALQTRVPGGAAGIAARRTTTGWQAISPPPGTLFTDGTTLFSAYVESGIKMARYDALSNTWDVANAETVVSDATNFPSTAGSNAMAWGGFNDNGAQVIVARTTGTQNLLSYVRASATSWSSNGNIGGNNVSEVRYCDQPNGGTNIWLAYQRGDVLQMTLYGGANNGWTIVPSGVTSFDCLGGQPLWIAAAVNGQIQLYYQTTGTGQWRPFNGPPRAGNPSFSFNEDVACTADSPELGKYLETMVLVWREKCGSGPWKTLYRSVR